MSWGAVIGAGVGLVGQAMDKKKNGGAGSSSQSYTPYATGDWIKALAQQGADLSGAYALNPMSERQTAAYDNQYALSDSARALVPSLLGQLGSQQVGFDPRNPTAKAKAFDWTELMSGLSANQKPVSGLSSMTAVAPVAWGGNSNAAPAQPQSVFAEYIPAGGA